MFKRLAEYITFLLVKNKILDIQLYDVYQYAIEVILLNGSILVSCFFISLLMGNLYHVLAFILFFIPLRMLVGGYHCKHSISCFFCSVIAYGLSGLLVQYAANLYINMIIQFLSFISIIIILIYSPLVNPNHPLTDYQVMRNKKIIYGLITVDFVLYIIFCKFHIPMVSSEMIFIILVALTLILGGLKTKILTYRGKK